MLKALPSEASDSTRPCSTSPQGLYSFNDRRKRNPRQPGARGLGHAPRLPACQGLSVWFAIPSFLSRGEPGRYPGLASPDCSGEGGEGGLCGDSEQGCWKTGQIFQQTTGWGPTTLCCPTLCLLLFDLCLLFLCLRVGSGARFGC